MRLADIEFRTRNRALIAYVTGEIDLSNSSELGGVLADATANHLLGLVVNLSEVEYLDSAGIQLIYQLRESLRSRGQVLRLVIPSNSPAYDAIRLAGLVPHIDIRDTLEQALEGLD
jgi:anti-sigma B factor antagonist